jgi:hypothetical protein
LVTIREIEDGDLDKGFLDVLNNLVPTDIDDTEYAKNILQKIGKSQQVTFYDHLCSLFLSM